MKKKIVGGGRTFPSAGRGFSHTIVMKKEIDGDHKKSKRGIRKAPFYRPNARFTLEFVPLCFSSP